MAATATGTAVATGAAASLKTDALAKLSHMATEAIALGAPSGAQRAAHIRKHFDTLSPKEAYQWLDPDAIKAEVGDAQLARANVWYGWRNVFSLLPLILTWLAISLATFEYQRDLTTYKQADNGQTFLALWQSGFHNSDPLTFAVTGFLDVALLVITLLLTLQAQRVEHSAKRRTDRFARALDVTTSQLMEASDAAGAITVGSDVSGQNVAEAVQRMFDRAKESVVQVSDRLDGLLTQLQADMTQLHTTISGSDAHVKTLTTVVGGLTTSAEALSDNADTYVKLGSDLNAQVKALDTTQKSVLAQLSAVASGVESAAKGISAVSTEVTTGFKPSISDMTSKVVDASTALGSASSQLAATSTQLATAASGLQTVNIQVHDLETTQAKLVSTLDGLGSGVTTSADSISGVAGAITGPMQDNIERMTQNVDSATRHLQQYQIKMDETVNKLFVAADQLSAAAQQLATVMGVNPYMAPPPPPPTPSGRRRGPTLPWPFRRKP